MGTKQSGPFRIGEYWGTIVSCPQSNRRIAGIPLGSFAGQLAFLGGSRIFALCLLIKIRRLWLDAKFSNAGFLGHVFRFGSTGTTAIPIEQIAVCHLSIMCSSGHLDLIAGIVEIEIVGEQSKEHGRGNPNGHAFGTNRERLD